MGLRVCDPESAGFRRIADPVTAGIHQPHIIPLLGILRTPVSLPSLPLKVSSFLLVFVAFIIMNATKTGKQLIEPRTTSKSLYQTAFYSIIICRSNEQRRHICYRHWNYFRSQRRNSISAKPHKRGFVTQQCLSDHIKRLEAQYGVPLFNRKPKISLTEYGAALQRAVQNIKVIETNLERSCTKSRRKSAELSCSESTPRGPGRFSRGSIRVFMKNILL